jgi:AcrR family transcriptional regulator
MGNGIKNKELVRKKERQIARAATKKFIEKGFHKTSVREIAKEAKLTIGNLYDYIDTKDDILYLAYKEIYSEWSEGLLKDPKILAISDPKEQLCAAIESMFDVFNKSRELIILAYRETKSLQKDHLKDVLGQESKLVEYFEQVIRRGVELGSFRKIDAALAANSIVFLLALVPLRGWNFMKNYNEKGVMEFTKDFVINSIIENKT